MADLETNITTGTPDHPGVHNAERREINLRASKAELAGLQSQVTADRAAAVQKTAGMVVVKYGSDVTTPRPNAAIVWWQGDPGAGDPENAEPGDPIVVLTAAPVAGDPPTASFTVSDETPDVGQTITFDASGSAAAAGATIVSYEWYDAAGAPGEYPMGTGVTIDFAYQNAGAKFPTVAVTDDAGVSATRTMELNVTSTSTAPEPDPTDPAPTDLGSTIGAYMAQAGGQTIVLPDGDYTAGNDVGHTHDSWLILKAATPGGVRITDPLEPRACSRIMFVGMVFEEGARAGYHQSADANDRIVFWYCEASAPVGAGLSTGIHTHGGNNYAIAGCDVHRCEHDGLKTYSNDTVVQGTRVWDIRERNPGQPNDYHTDSVQAEDGENQLYESCVMGVAPDGTDSGDGHVQLMRQHSSTWRNVWLANSSSIGLMADSWDSGDQTTVTLDGVRIWGNQDYGSGEANYATGANNGAEIVEEGGGLLTGPPPGSETPPDVAWRAANPYNSHGTWLTALGW